jgi:hypothetical protein
MAQQPARAGPMPRRADFPSNWGTLFEMALICKCGHDVMVDDPHVLAALLLDELER